MAKKAILDYGHGGNDPGATGNGLKEKDLTLSIGKKVTKILRDHGVTVIETRSTDKTISLKSRTDLANKEKADVFVSVHINGFKQESANGVETFSYPGSRNGARLAKSIQDELVRLKLFKSNRGTKTANFHVLRETSMPAALTELGFITNKDDAAILKSKQNELALAVAKGILVYLGIAYKKPVTPKLPTSNKDDGFYRVVVGSYQDKKNAEEQQKKLKEKGFDSFLVYYEK